MTTTTLGTGIKNTNNLSPISVPLTGTLLIGKLYVASIVGNVVLSLDANYSASDGTHTWTRRGTLVNGSSCQIAQYWVVPTTQLVNPTLTFTPANSVGRNAAVADDPDITPTASPTDTFVSNSGTSVSVAPGSSGTLAQADEYAYMSNGFAQGATSSSVNNSFTLESMEFSTQGAADKRVQSADRTVSATTALAPTLTISSSVAWATMLGTYKIQTTVTQNGAAALSGAGAFGSDASVTTLPAAALSGVGSMNAIATLIQPAAAALVGSGSMNSTALNTTLPAAALAGAGSMNVAPSVTTLPAAALVGAGSMNSVASVTTLPAAALVGAGSMGAVASNTVPVAANLSGAGTMTAGATRVLPGAAVLVGVGSFTSAGTVTPPSGGAADLFGVGSMNVVPLVTTSAATALVGAGSLNAGATRSVPAAAALVGTGTFGSDALVTTLPSASLVGAGSFAAVGTLTPQSGGAAALAGVGTFTSAGLTTGFGATTLVGHGSLVAIATLTPVGVVYLYVPEWLVTDAVLALLRAELPGNVQVYDHSAPVTDREFPYVILYRIPGGEWSGPPLSDPQADIAINYQIDAVGQRRDQVEMLGTRVGQIMTGYINGYLEHHLTLPLGISECGRLKSDVPPGIDVEGVPPHQVYTFPGRFEVAVTPS